MNYITNLLIFTLISIIAEYILLSIIDNVYDPEIGSGLRKVCKVLFIFLLLFYVVLFVLCLAVAFSAFQNGKMETGIKMLISTIIIGVGIYYLFLRKIRLKIINKMSSN